MNRAAKKLREILEGRDKGAFSAFAESIGASPDQLSKWLSDSATHHRPSLKYRLKINELVAIGLRDWDDETDQHEGAA